MAEENQDGQEKTEEPTQQRLQKAAEDGQLLTTWTYKDGVRQ